MSDLVLWETCRRCIHFARCSEPFAASGICPHPTEAHKDTTHPLVCQPVASHRYARLLQHDPRAASIFHCWRRGKPPHNEDYLYLHGLAYDANTRDEAAYFLITDILNEVCVHWAGDVLVYYFDTHDTSPYFPVRSSKVWEIVNAATSMAVRCCGRALVENYAGHTSGADWTRLLIDQMRLSTWGALQLQHLDFSGLSDEEFRIRFEEEWSRLLHFPDLFYGFRVLPRVGLDDFVRYSLLPHGDANIRGQISNYLMHQWSEYPHLGQLLSPLFADMAFGKRLKKIYEPLVEKVVSEALKNSQIPSGDERARAEIEVQVREVFEAAMKKFRFYGPRKKKRLWGKIGMIGLPQTPELRRYFDERAKKSGLQNEGNPLTLSDVSEVGFAYYIDLKLRVWLARNYPPEPAPCEVVGDRGVFHRLRWPALCATASRSAILWRYQRPTPQLGSGR